MDFSPLWVSIQVAFSATIASVFLGILLCYLTFRYTRYQTFIDTLLTLPIILPPTVIGLVLLICFGNNSWLGSILSRLGLPVVFSIRGAILAATIVSLPLFFRTVSAGIQTIDSDLLYVARTLGMTEYEVFIKIVIPQIYPVFLSGIILSFARALGEFGATLMLAGNIPGKTQTMSIAIYTAIQSGNEKAAYVWGGVIIIFSLISIGIMQKWRYKN